MLFRSLATRPVWLKKFKAELAAGIPALKFHLYTSEGPPFQTKISLLEKEGKQYLSWERDRSKDKIFVYEVYENQRFQSGAGGWGSSYPGHLLPTDRAQYTDESGYTKYSIKGLDELRPFKGCEWTDEWQVEKGWTTTDMNGWHYASDMYLLSRTFKSGKTYSDKTGCWVRRRKWRRTMQEGDVQVINVVGVKTGIATEPIKKYGRKGNKHRYVSIMTHNASFDVALESDEHRDSLVLGAKLLIQDEAVNVYKRGIPITKYSQKDPTTGKIPAPKKIVMKLVEQTGRNLLAFDDGPEDKAAVELEIGRAHV